MSSQAFQILDARAVESRLLRMAYQIYESHYGKSHFVLIGIDVRGGFLAERLAEHLERISPLDIRLIRANLDRDVDGPLLGIDLDIASLEELEGQDLVVVDDVLYSGNTLLNVVSILLQAKPSSIQTVLLIDRGHHTVPIAADITGIKLASTLQQHVEVKVDFDTKTASAYLS